MVCHFFGIILWEHVFKSRSNHHQLCISRVSQSQGLYKTGVCCGFGNQYPQHNRLIWRGFWYFCWNVLHSNVVSKHGVFRFSGQNISIWGFVILLAFWGIDDGKNHDMVRIYCRFWFKLLAFACSEKKNWSFIGAAYVSFRENRKISGLKKYRAILWLSWRKAKPKFYPRQVDTEFYMWKGLRHVSLQWMPSIESTWTRADCKIPKRSPKPPDWPRALCSRNSPIAAERQRGRIKHSCTAVLVMSDEATWASLVGRTDFSHCPWTVRLHLIENPSKEALVDKSRSSLFSDQWH